ncbi:hypothetical protein [Agromyces sp. GXS1127]|uniref:hypothetical protein n=1 Tax=Agromyces sp. GXS1127 TaxID=3424181 RepID=UPI003D318382
MNAPTQDATASAAAARQPEEPRNGWFRRTPLWVRIAVPAVIVAGGAAIVAGAVGAGSAAPADADALCREAATSRLEQRGHTDIEFASSLQQTEADGAQRLSGTVTFVGEGGATHHAEVRCVIRGAGDDLSVASVRFFD